MVNLPVVDEHNLNNVLTMPNVIARQVIFWMQNICSSSMLKLWIDTLVVKKQNLPFKICMVCARPFTWRKKWEKVWEEVKYCSDKCRKNRSEK